MFKFNAFSAFGWFSVITPTLFLISSNTSASWKINIKQSIPPCEVMRLSNETHVPIRTSQQKHLIVNSNELNRSCTHISLQYKAEKYGKFIYNCTLNESRINQNCHKVSFTIKITISALVEAILWNQIKQNHQTTDKKTSFFCTKF